MTNFLIIRITIALFFISSTFSLNPEPKTGEWCVTDKQIPVDVVQEALDWACKNDGVDCSMINSNSPCFLPNTTKDHASVIFNTYYQHYKHKGGICYFNGAAVITQFNPSHGECHYEYIP